MMRYGCRWTEELEQGVGDVLMACGWRECGWLGYTVGNEDLGELGEQERIA